jgi:predicted ATP-grasp superfamily ATP-dependent carboligase
MRLSLVWLARRLLPRTFLPDIAIHGRHSPKWQEALDVRSGVWRLLARSGSAQAASGTPRWWRKRVVVPLMERHIASLSGGCHVLVPDAEALAVLADKARFARYAAEIGAGDLLPLSIPVSHPTFPAILKRTNLNGGRGIAFVASRQQFDRKLARTLWRGQDVLLQEAIPARFDHVTHVVCVRGRVVWHQTYSYPLDHRRAIRGPVGDITIKRSRARAEDIRAFERLLLPLAYDGPANIDFRRRADGSLAILEINPRLGGSLMRPENVHDLAGCLRAIVRHARWRPEAADPVAARQEIRA